MKMAIVKNLIPEIDWKRADLLIDLALEEDLGDAKDTTTLSVVPESAVSRAVLLCKEDSMILAGLDIARRVFEKVEPALKFTALKQDGDTCVRGEFLAEISGPARGIINTLRTITSP